MLDNRFSLFNHTHKHLIINIITSIQIECVRTHLLHNSINHSTFATSKYKNTLFMEKEPSNIRIVDIAEMAGVSVGTVDRVIHKRGRVSEENKIKVEEILKKMNYQPNIIARSLALKKKYHLVAVIPFFEQGEYWEAISNGIDKAASEIENYNVYVEKLFFNQYSNKSFDEIIENLPKEDIDGMLVATLFTDSVIRFSHLLNEKEIPYVYVDSNITDENQLAYFGTDSYDGGVVAAKLLCERLGKSTDILISKIIHEGKNDSNQGKNRKRGFCDYLKENNFEGKLIEAELKLNDPLFNQNILDDIFRKHPQIEGAVIFNSTCYILGNYLKLKKMNNIRLVGYDLIDKNTELLSEGVISTLIAQRPEAQGYNGIKSLSNYLVLKQEPEKINLMPIDILIKENLKYYLNNKL